MNAEQRSEAAAISYGREKDRQRLSRFVIVMAVASMFSVFAMVLGPLSSGLPGSGASHSHVFLTAEAAATHNHDDHVAGEHDVVSLNDHSAVSSAFHVLLSDDGNALESLVLVSMALSTAPENLYAEPTQRVLDEPPQLS